MDMEAFFARLAAANAVAPRTHTAGGPVTPAQLAQWQRRFPKVALPADLVALLHRHNGFCLFQSPERPDGVIRLLPLGKWLSRKKLAMQVNGETDPHADALDGYMAAFPERTLALTTDSAASGHVLLDAAAGRYTYLDRRDPTPRPIGAAVDELLDWFDRTWLQGGPPADDAAA